MNTVPAMTDAERILTRPDIQEMIESLAAKVHEAWANQRKAEGWMWGKAHNADLKQHPCLVEYDQLPESEKEVDRRTARTSIQGLLDLGFEVLPPKRKHAGEHQHFAQFLQKLASTATIPLAELRSIWSQCSSNPFLCPPEIHLRLGERMLKQGEAILAYDVLSQGLGALEQGPGANEARGPLQLRLTQLLALALAQSGAVRARQRYPAQTVRAGLHDAGNAGSLRTRLQGSGWKGGLISGPPQMPGAVFPELLCRV